MFKQSRLISSCVTAIFLATIPVNFGVAGPKLPVQQSIERDDQEPDSTGMAIKLENCLEAADDYRSENDKHDCIGIHARPCILQPENDNTLGMARCYQQERDGWSVLLRSSLGGFRDRPQSAAAFKRTQELWQTYRDARCGFYAIHYQGGSMARWQSVRCEMIETARRTIDVSSFGRDSISVN
jgi:hypothetical protein